jgi:vitamin B12 transporter
MVEQIEIVRGPLSAVYGSDAVAGVINIIPRRAGEKPSLEVGGSLGNLGTREGMFAATGKSGNFDYALGGSWLDVGQQVLDDQFRIGAIALNAHLALGRGKMLRFVIRDENAIAAGFPINGGGPDYSLLRVPQSVHTNELVTGMGWRQEVNARWFYTLDFDVFDRVQNSNSPPVWDAIPPTLQSEPSQAGITGFRRMRVNYANNVRLMSHLTADFGGGWRREVGSSTGVVYGTIPDVFNLTRNSGDGNAELTWSSSLLSATAGLRADKTDGFRTVFSPNAGVNLRLGERGPHFKASWGKGYKLPSFYSLADRLVGNPTLKPEYSRSFDVGLEGDLAHGHLRPSVTYFYNSYRDLVDFSSQLFKLVNLSAATTQGVEFAMAIPLTSRLDFTTHGSYMSWALQDDPEPLRDEPHWISGAGLDWKPTARLMFHMESQWVGRRYDFSVPLPNVPAVGGYSDTNFSASYTFNRSLTAFTRVENLWNSHFHEFIGFPSPGAQARVGLTYRIR